MKLDTKQAESSVSKGGVANENHLTRTADPFRDQRTAHNILVFIHSRIVAVSSVDRQQGLQKTQTESQSQVLFPTRITKDFRSDIIS